MINWRSGAKYAGAAAFTCYIGAVQAAQRGFSDTTVAQPSFGSGFAFVDLDSDGDPDIVAIGNAAGIVGLFEKLGNGTFVDHSSGSGIPTLSGTSAVCAVDYNGDGKPDLYFSNWLFPNTLCRNEGGFEFADTSAAAGVDDAGDGMGSTWDDYDGYGDLIVQDNDEPLRLYINHEGELRNWVRFNIRGEENNRFAIGAQVRIRTGSVWQLQEVFAGANTYKGHNELTVHFGVDTASTIDEVVVTWPGGLERTLTNLAVDRTYQVYPQGDVPTASAWGLVQMSISLLVLATLVVRHRALFPASTRAC